MKKNVLKYIVAIIVVLIVICFLAFSLLKKGAIIEISEDEIRQTIVEKFPIKKTHLLFLEIIYSDPIVELLDDKNRVRLGLTATPNIAISGNSISGSAIVNGGFRYEPETGKFYLTGFTIEKVSIDQTKGISLDKISSSLSDALEDVYKNYPIYTLKDNDLKQATAKMLVRKIEIANKKIYIHLGF